MAPSGRAIAIGCSALAATLFVLGSTGQSSLRGDRRLQMVPDQVAGAGVQAAQQGVQQGVQFTGQLAQEGQGVFNHGPEIAGHVANRIAENPYEGINEGLQYNPQSWLNAHLSKQYQFFLFIAQAVFAVLYYCMVVYNYPKWYGPSPLSAQLQAQAAPSATTSTSPSNCCLSYLCPQARAAHTFDRTGILDYWCGVLAMFLCPFCTLCYANACTDLNPKLGGEPVNLLSSTVCTWCCSCCVIAQDAESLDMATGARTGPCSVTQVPTPYGGMGQPGMMMMYPRY